MSPLLLSALRRLTAYALGLAVVLVLVFKVLPAFGVLGPSAEEEVDAAARALETARAYGATDDTPALLAGRGELERARALAAAGEGRRAKQAAKAARARGIEAQRVALVNREESRRQAKLVVARIDRTLNDLEDVYADTTPGLDKATVSGLFSLMKKAREAGATLVLAFEQGNFHKVIEDEKETAELLLSVRDSVKAAKRKR